MLRASIYEGNQPCDNLYGSCSLWLCLTTTSFNPWQSSGHCTFPNSRLLYKHLLRLSRIASPWIPSFSLFSITLYLSLAVPHASCCLHQFDHISKCWRVSNWFKDTLEPSQAAMFISFLPFFFFFNVQQYTCLGDFLINSMNRWILATSQDFISFL